MTISCDLEARPTVADFLKNSAYLVLAQGQNELAAYLLGAADALREVIGRPSQLEEHERALALVQEALGTKRFIGAWEAGWGMTWQEAVALALGEAAEEQS